MTVESVDTTREIRAAGAVLWRPGGRDGAKGSSGYEVAVVHRPRYDDWSLPKGKLDGDEPEPVAAAREVLEETGCRCVLGPFVAEISYSVGGEHKTVGYYSARSLGGDFTPGSEVDELRWLPVDKARKLVSYERDVEVLDAFTSLGAGLTTVLLVRHAKAGSREGWVGDDDLRPLTENGERQAERLQAILALFGPDRVFSASRLRCVQTVGAVAAELGVEISHERLLAEDAYVDDPDGTAQRLLEIAADGGTPLICSQGGVIPGLVTALAERDDVQLPAEPVAKKASIWLLAFRPGKRRPRLVTAHYVPPPPED